MSETSARTRAPWALQGLVVASIVLPLLVFAGGGWLAWRATVRDATANLQSVLAVSQEQATRVFDTHILLGNRLNDVVGGVSDDTVIAREGELHDRLNAIIAGYSQANSVLVVGADGRALVSSSRYPIDHSINFSDREYFKAMRATPMPYYISGIVSGRVSQQEVFTVAIHRGSNPHQFAGIILIGVSPSYFRNFDREMFGGSSDYTASLTRDDGTQLAVYPGVTPPSQTPVRNQLLLDAIAQKPQAGITRGTSSIDGAERLMAYRKLAKYPIYVTVGRRWDSIVGEWRSLMATHLIFGIPATLSLLALSLMARRQALRQNAILTTLQQEVHRREQAEEALRQSQKMEAVGQPHRRHRARLQQPSDSDQQQYRAAAASAAQQAATA